MVAKKPRVVIVGGGMAGLTAAYRLHTTSATAANTLELSVVEAGNRIGGRIRTSEFAGVRVEMGATWIHGIGGSPVHDIARKIGALDSPTPWERMDGFPEEPVTIAEGGLVVDPNLHSSISSLYKSLMDFAKTPEAMIGAKDVSVGSFLRRGLESYRCSGGDATLQSTPPLSDGVWSLESLEDALFAMNENTERTYTSANDLATLDLAAEREYREFPDEQITIAKGYSRVIEYFASALPPGMVQMGRKLERIEWSPDGGGGGGPPVSLHFDDGSVIEADHVIVTISLGVLKAGVVAPVAGKGLFSPALPAFKRDAISRLGFGVVNKLFMEKEPANGGGDGGQYTRFPYLQMAFHQDPAAAAAAAAAKIPSWIRRTTSICPVYGGSNVLLAWFAGKEAAELEELKDEEIIRGVHGTLEGFSPAAGGNLTRRCNGNGGGGGVYGRIRRVMSSGWGKDPLFLGSYSYVAVGSSGEDLDLMAEPLPRGNDRPLQILFAGEATHRTHYSTTHGAYFSGIREANRLLQHYKLLGL